MPVAAFRELLGDVEEDCARYDVVDEADFLRAASIERAAFENDVQRRRQPNQPRQLRCPAPGGKNAELRFGQSDRRFRTVRHYAPVATDRELASAAETCAVDGGDFDLRQLREAVKCLLTES